MASAIRRMSSSKWAAAVAGVCSLCSGFADRGAPSAPTACGMRLKIYRPIGSELVLVQLDEDKL